MDVDVDVDGDGDEAEEVELESAFGLRMDGGGWKDCGGLIVINISTGSYTHKSRFHQKKIVKRKLKVHKKV